MLKNAIQLTVELCVNLAKVLCKFDVHVHVFVTFFFFFNLLCFYDTKRRALPRCCFVSIFPIYARTFMEAFGLFRPLNLQHLFNPRFLHQRKITTLKIVLVHVLSFFLFT